MHSMTRLANTRPKLTGNAPTITAIIDWPNRQNHFRTIAAYEEDNGT